MENQIVEFSEFEAQLAEFKGKYDGVVYDLTIPEEEKQARSDRLTIGKVIANLDRKHKELKAPLKEKVDLIDGERKRIKDDLLKVQGKIKAQIEDHERKIQEHAEMLQAKVDAITALGEFDISDQPDSKLLVGRLTDARSVDIDDSYEHRKADATLALVDVTKKLEQLYHDRLVYEEEQAELEQLRKEAEERERKDREEAIRREAEQKAKEQAEREAKAAIDEAERKTREAEQAKLKAEEESKIKAEIAAREERERIEREQAEAKAKREAEQAKEDAKKAKQAHWQKIHSAIKKDLMANGVDEKLAISIIELIKDGKVSHLSIDY